VIRAAALVVLVLSLGLGCKRRAEILPAGAEDVKRSDAIIDGVNVREYSYQLSGYPVVCEAREYETSDQARAEAKKKIAERPAAESKSENARFASSGRSVWLWAGKNLFWCMVAAANADSTALEREFKSKYEELK